MSDRLLRLIDVADRLAASKWTAWHLVSTGEIKSIRIRPRTVRVPESEVDAYIARKLEEAS